MPGSTEYKLYYKEAGSIAANGSDGTLAATQTGAYSGSLSGLTPGAAYSAVLSLTRGGHTVYSDAKTVAMPAFTAPALTFTTGTSSGAITYSWTAANPADGVTYTLYYKQGTAIAADGSDGTATPTQTDAYSGTLSGLTPGAVYSAIVKAVRNGDAVYSAVKQAAAYEPPSAYELAFNGSLANAQPYPASVTMTGTESYEDNARAGRKAIKLNQANYINLGQKFDYSQSFTIAFWVKVTSGYSQSDPAVFGNKRWNSGGGSVRGFVLCMSSNNLKVNIGNGSSNLGDVSLGNVTADWAHVAVTFNVPGNTVKYYYNGALVQTKSYTISGGLNSGLNSYIGQTAGNNTDSSRYNTNMACQIQDFLLKNGTMTDTEIAALAAP